MTKNKIRDVNRTGRQLHNFYSAMVPGVHKNIFPSADEIRASKPELTFWGRRRRRRSILKKSYVRVWTGLICQSMRVSDGIVLLTQRSIGMYKIWEISWPTQRISYSNELCFMVLLNIKPSVDLSSQTRL